MLEPGAVRGRGEAIRAEARGDGSRGGGARSKTCLITHKQVQLAAEAEKRQSGEGFGKFGAEAAAAKEV